MIGLRVQRVLQSPWVVDQNNSDTRYCIFYLLLESGLLVNLFEEELYRSQEEIFTLIDTNEIKASHRIHYIDRRINSVSIDQRTSDLIVMFDSGWWLSPQLSLMGYGNYLMTGNIRDFNELDRESLFINYFDGSAIQPWVIE